MLTPRGEPRLFLCCALALLVASFVLGAYDPRQPSWSWGVSVGFGLPIVVVARIVVDTVRIFRGAIWPEAEEHTFLSV